MKPVLAIARVSFKELLHDRIIYNILIAFLLLFVMSIFLAQLAIQKIWIFQVAFSLSTQQWVLSIMAIMIGSSSLSREFQRKSYFLIKTRPVSTLQILLGKVTGNFAFLAMTSLLFSALNAVLLTALVQAPQSQFYWASFLSAFEPLPIVVIAIILSIHSSTAVTIGIASAIAIIGNSLSTLAMISNRANSPALNAVNSIAQVIFPQLEAFHLNASAIYDLPIAKLYPASIIGYAFFYSMSLMILGSILLRNKRI